MDVVACVETCIFFFISAIQEGLNLSHSVTMSEANSLPEYRSGTVRAAFINAFQVFCL